uniref:7TM_GPCR_Srx domain-containing protein n=1 Tax=Strongyloides venezuelensis TaxID=75913 RepID=A0A0K0F3Y7_STRVS
MYIFYNIEFGTWDYSFQESSPFKNIDNKVLIFENVSSFILFLVVIIKIYLNPSNKTSNKRKNKSMEIYLFIQVFINGIFFIIDEILWEYGNYICPDSDILYTVINFVWSLTPGKDGIMNIIFLKNIRAPVVLLFSKRRSLKNRTKRKIWVTDRRTNKM